MEFTLEQIADFLQGEVHGDKNASVSNFGKIEDAKSGELTFLSNKKYINHIYSTQATAVLVGRDMVFDQTVSANLIKVDDAYQALSKLLTLYQESLPQKTGIENPNYVDQKVVIPEDAYIGAFAYIGKGVSLGKGVKLYPHSYIGDNVSVGEGTTIFAGAKIYNDCVVGANCIIHSNVVIGSDGFGFAPNSQGQFDKIPQIGNVVIEDDVEIGSGSTIDRATMGSTVIKRGSKLDNQLQIAHNVVIGEDSVIAAQTGIAGSTKIGHHAMIGGQVGIVGHLNIGNYVKIQAQSGISKSLKDKEVVQGTPAISYGAYNKAYVHFRNLDSLVKKVYKLEKDNERLNNNE